MLALNDSALIGPPPSIWPARRFVYWCVLAWRMFRNAPLRLLGLIMLPMLVEAVLQFSIPVAGVVLSKLLVPMVSAWCLVAMDQFARTGFVAMGLALRKLLGLGGKLVLVALVSAGVFALQVLVGCSLAGPQAALGLVTADPAAILIFTPAQVACVLASGVLPAMLLFFTVPRIVLDGLGLGMALRENLRMLGRGWRPLSFYMVLSMALVAGFVYQPLLLLLLMPLGYVSYWAYRDRFHQQNGV